MINFHKLAIYYSTLVMWFIGGTFVRNPNVLLDAFGVLPLQEDATLSIEGMDPVYQFAYHLGFASHLVVGLAGLYAIWHNTTIHRRFALLVFGSHQAIFAWAGMKYMPARWQEGGFLAPVQINVILAIFLFVSWEPEPVVQSLKRRKLRDNKNK